MHDGNSAFAGHPSDSDNGDGDYDYELSLEMKRQKIQRELMKLEQENMDKREEIVIKKEVRNSPDGDVCSLSLNAAAPVLPVDAV